MLPGTIRLCGTLVLGGLLCAGLAGCGAPSAAKVLEEAQAAMEAVDSYTVTVSSELRLRPQSGAEPVTAQVDAVIQATREPYALCQSAVYSLYAGEEGGVSTAVSYTLPSGDSEQAYISYLSYDGETWYVQEEPGATAERTSSFQYLSGLFAQDLPHIRVEATQFRGEDAYVLSGPLDPDATASLMAGAEDGLTGAEEALTGSVDVYLDPDAFLLLGVTVRDYTFTACGETLDSAALQEIWEAKLEPVYPYRAAGPEVEAVSGRIDPPAAPKIGVAKPKVVIPVFPGTNCEYDTARAFRAAGAEPEVLVIRNLTPADVTASCEALVKAIDGAQMVMLPGGFSGGDEPDGSAKFIASFFRSPAVTEAVRRLLFQRDGLMLGICNGFQALIKLGLVPYGDIRPITADDPTLTFNTIGRHQSMLVRTRVASTGSPWLSRCEPGDEHLVAISHGEGRFVAPQPVLEQLAANGQIATQYIDLDGRPTMDLRYNPNGSMLAIEGITSPDGRILGKMGHSERRGDRLYENVSGDKFQPIFEGGVDYFKI